MQNFNGRGNSYWGAYDYVTVGKFKLTKDIIVVDLKEINQISPFIEGVDCLEYAINKEHLNKINDVDTEVYRIDMIDYRKHIE